MTHFDKLTKELGWNKPYKNIPLYTIVNKRGENECVFDIGNYYDISKDDESLTLEHIKSILNFYPKTIYESKDSKWVLPMLVSDYHSHRFDWDKELIWAKKTMKQNKKLTPLQFSTKIREKL
jgi:hypothetical protein